MKFIESQLRSQVKSIRGQRLHETLDQSNMQVMYIKLFNPCHY